MNLSMTGEPSARRSRFVVAVGLAAATLWLFWPATAFEFIHFDDDLYVAANEIVRQGLTPEGLRWAWSAVYEGYWLPLLWLSYMLDATLFGPGAFGFHLTNIALHAANAALLFLLLNGWTRRMWLPLFVAALFAWHPLRVESVAWIAERKDMLSGFFFLLSLYAHTRAVRLGRLRAHAITAVCMALGLMAKPILVTLPFLLLLLDLWPLERWRWSLEDLRAKANVLIGEKLLLWALSALFCLVTYGTQGAGRAIHGADIGSWQDRLGAVPIAYVFYLCKTILPVDLSMIYADPTVSAGAVLAAVVLLLGLTWAVLAAGRRCPALPVGWFWFLGMLVPVIGVVRVGTVHLADRFTYLPSIGLGLCAAWGAAHLLVRWRSGSIALWASALVILAGCAWQTRAVLPAWKNSRSAFENVLESMPGSVVANNNLGALLAKEGDFGAAEQRLRRALAADPGYANANKNLGNVLFVTGRKNEAARHYRAAIEREPDQVEALNNLAWLLATDPKGTPEDRAQAVHLAERAVALGGRDNPALMSTLSAAREAAARQPRAPPAP